MNTLSSSDRYMTHDYLRRRFDRVGRKLAFRAKTQSEWKRWTRKTRLTLRRLTGYQTMQKTALHPAVTETREFDDYIRQRVEIHTEPGIVMPFYVLIPKNTPPPYPAVINPHGHGSGGKYSPAGCLDVAGIAPAIEAYNYDYGVQFARAGFIAFCPDARGFGERQEKLARDRNIMDPSCLWINQMAIPLGQTVTGMWAWDIHRLIDYIQTRPDCRPDRIGCAGLSGGGLQTLWATALDTRIRCAVISGYLYGYKEALLDLHGNCSCNYVPRLWEYVDMGDIAALIAPRPLVIETGTEDPLNGAGGLSNVRSQIAIMRKAYRLFRAERLLKHDVFEGGHRWHGTVAIPWMSRFLK